MTQQQRFALWFILTFTGLTLLFWVITQALAHLLVALGMGATAAKWTAACTVIAACVGHDFWRIRKNLRKRESVSDAQWHRARPIP